MREETMTQWGKGLLLLFFASVPWDISKVLFPPYDSGPQSPTVFTFVRIATFLLVAWGAVRFVQSGAGKNTKRLAETPLAWAPVPLFLAVLISLSGSLLPGTTVAEGARLVLLWLLGLSVALAIQSEWSPENMLEWIWQIIFLLATLTALFALFQYVTGMGIWGGGVNVAGGRRVNATFMDPNIFARYLDISILASLSLFLHKVWRRWWVVVGVILQIAALGTTFSRTGWIILALGLIVLLIVYLRRKLAYLLGALGGLVVIGAGVSFIPAVHQRLATFSSWFDILGQRIPLIQGGWAMFRDHPLTGVGLGCFQWAIENPYSSTLAAWSYVTRSHTTLITVAAEMGIWGVLAMLLFLGFMIGTALSTKGKLRPYALANMAGVLVIWLSSQGEGRFFEDPMLWAFWGLGLAIQWKGRGASWYD